MADSVFVGGTIVLPDRLLTSGQLEVTVGRISAIHDTPHPSNRANTHDLAGLYPVPGFIALHIQGGAGADFMDGDADAFRTVCRAHLRHGTTSLLPTTTVARRDHILAVLELCRRFQK